MEIEAMKDANAAIAIHYSGLLTHFKETTVVSLFSQRSVSRGLFYPTRFIP